MCYVSSSQHKPFTIGYLYYPIPTTLRFKDRTNDVKYPLHLILWVFQVLPAHLNKSGLYTGVVFVLFDKTFSSFPKNVFVSFTHIVLNILTHFLEMQKYF